MMSDTKRTYTRRIYSLLDVSGDFGGLLEVVMLLTTLFLSPWAEFQFTLKALQKLYEVKTKRTSEFRKTESNKQTKKREKIEQNLRN